MRKKVKEKEHFNSSQLDKNESKYLYNQDISIIYQNEYDKLQIPMTSRYPQQIIA